jgi:hypothetical protein
MNLKKIIIACLILSNNSWAQSSTASKVIDYTIPLLNQISNTELGEPIFRKEKKRVYSGAVTLDTLKILTKKISGFLKPCDLILFEEDKLYKYYKPRNETMSILEARKKFPYQRNPILRIDKSNNAVVDLDITFFPNLKIENEKPGNPFLVKEKNIEVITSNDNFVRQLIYNGKAGDVINFTYKEFINDLARSAFSQNIQYDLKESNIIGYKGAKIEIINATNLKIEYKVLSDFRD